MFGGKLTQLAVERITNSVVCPHYDVRLVHREAIFAPRVLRLSERELGEAKYIKFLRAKNAHDYHIFFRPFGREYVLVDDLTAQALAKIADDGIRTAAELATSPGNFQAWVRIGNRNSRISDDDMRQVARYLAHRYGGDMRSAKSSQLGRLPGFRNRKDKYRDDKGRYPLVVIRRAAFTGPQEMVVTRAKSFVLPPSPPSARSASGLDAFVLNSDLEDVEAFELWEEAMSELAERFGALPQDDRSAIDFAVMRHFLHNGLDPSDAAKVLAIVSKKARSRGADYVVNTVRKAYSL